MDKRGGGGKRHLEPFFLFFLNLAWASVSCTIVKHAIPLNYIKARVAFKEFKAVRSLFFFSPAGTFSSRWLRSRDGENVWKLYM